MFFNIKDPPPWSTAQKPLNSSPRIEITTAHSKYKLNRERKITLKVKIYNLKIKNLTNKDEQEGSVNQCVLTVFSNQFSCKS